jgi:hypothetical protein
MHPNEAPSEGFIKKFKEVWVKFLFLLCSLLILLDVIIEHQFGGLELSVLVSNKLNQN